MSKSASIPSLGFVGPMALLPEVRPQRTLLSCHTKALEVQKCAKQFSVKVGTIFEDSPIPLDKWLVALWMLVNCKNGISSYEVGRDLGITQKSAWFMLQRLRWLCRTNR